MMNSKVYCGVEGGASFSKLVLVSDNGNILCSLEGPATNYMLVGLEKGASLLFDLLEKAKSTANLSKDFVLESLGLCLSGCENERLNEEFKSHFLKNTSIFVKSISIASDTVGPLYAASPNGGVVLICGTGSNSLLINPDGSTSRCGGWGHMIGDESSAWWISCKAIKTLFDDEDNLEKCPYDLTKVKELILEHFKIEDKFGVLSHCYMNFNKTYFAGLCLKLAKAALDGDLLCQHIFYLSGKMLGRMVVAMKPKVDKQFFESENGLPIICVGSVFKSWSLLEKGFSEAIEGHYDNCTLWTLTNTGGAIGAAYFGAKSAGVDLPIDRSQYTNVLHRYRKKNDTS